MSTDDQLDKEEEDLLWKLYVSLSGARKYRLVRIRRRATARRHA